MQEGVGHTAAEKSHGTLVGQLCSGGILLWGDDGGGVTAGGLIDDALPVEVESLLAVSEFDGEPLAIGDQHGSRAELLCRPSVARRGASGPRADDSEDLHQPGDLCRGEVEALGGMRDKGPGRADPSHPFVDHEPGHL